MNKALPPLNCRYLPIIALLFCASMACADEPLDEIVVSATRLETTVRDAARAVSVVDKERIQNGTQQLGLDEALAGVPGLYMQNRYNFAQDLRISLRGFGARSSFGVRGIKIVVDGIPETLPDGQAQVDSIDLGSAQRIEVLRGPASSLYGNASGGVIAIESELGEGEPFVEGSVGTGELGFRSIGLKTGGQLGTADYLLNVSHLEFDGWREHSEARGSILNAKVGIPVNDDRLTVAFNVSDQPVSNDPGGINAAQAASAPRTARDVNLQYDAGEALDQQRLGFVFARDRDAGSLTLRNYYTWRDFAGKLPFNGGGIVEFDRFVYGAGALYRLGDVLPANWELAFGIDLDRQDDDRRRFNNENGTYGDLSLEQQEEVASNAVFAQAQYLLNERWSFSAGLRFDEVRFDVRDRFLSDGDDSGEVTFDQLSPSFGINAKLGRHILFANWSSGFETPTTTELANPDASGGFNASLKPQRANNFELGFKTGNDKVFFEVAAFLIKLKDELVPFELPAFPGRTFFVNAGRSDRTGLETAVSWEHESGFSVDASYTWSDFTYDAFVDENGNDFAGKRLPGLPEHFAYVGLNYRSDAGTTVSLDTSYSGDLYADNANGTKVDDYTVANLRLYREITMDRWRVRPHIGINNLFDERYNSNIRINAFGGRYFEPAPDRNVYLGVVVGFEPGN
ncbi:MAG: TonB-dependent receptor [Woeseia sp.]|nr:TonB-dependent receptor [Woeseia sp.]MBT8096390.1 TonB-dependent receptor [Woeseia sp.]NNE62091.1 TonB-dependent receptor [Woeseia sp.]NNL55420.1 TonB-dependent receptor [Woeseia sp.]